MARWTDVLAEKLSKEYQLRGKRTKPSKYRNKKLPPDPGHALGWDSQLEKYVFTDLLYREKAGLIRDIRRQVTIRLTPLITHHLDFVVTDTKTGSDFGVEAKGGRGNEQWTLKRRLYIDFGPFPIEVWDGDSDRRVLKETLPAGKYRWRKK